MTTGYAVGLTPQQRFLQSYNPSVGIDDMGTGRDPDFGYDGNNAGYVGMSNYQGFQGMNGYNNYGGGYGGNYGGYNQNYQQSYGNQGGYGVGPMLQGETQESYNKRIEDFEDGQFERQIQLQIRNQNAPARVQGPQSVILDKADMLASQIKRGEQDKIAPAFDALVKSIKDKYMVNGQLPKGMTDAKLTQIARAEAKSTYAQMTGVPLTADIEANGSGAFWQGMKKVLSLGFADSKCATDNIAYVEGDTVNKSVTAGKILGGFSVGGILGAIAIFIAKKGKP